MSYLDEETIHKLRDCLVETVAPIKIILFGSYARGEADESGDIDIAVITSRDKANRQNLIKSRVALRQALTGRDIAIDFILQSDEQFNAARQHKGSIQETLALEGMVIYQMEKSAIEQA
jgi:predicted nucleotidyltransferase